MKFRTSNDINIDKLVPGAVLVVENFGHVVLKQAKFSARVGQELAQADKLNKRLRKRIDRVKLVVCLPNLLPGSGGLIDDQFPILRTNVLAGTVLEVVSEKKLAKRKLVVTEASLSQQSGCSGGCGGRGGECGGCDHDHGDADQPIDEPAKAPASTDLAAFYAGYLNNNLCSGLDNLKLPIGFKWTWSIENVGGNQTPCVTVSRRGQLVARIYARVVGNKVFHSTSPDLSHPTEVPLAFVFKDVIQAHMNKPGVAPLQFDGVPWVNR